MQMSKMIFLERGVSSGLKSFFLFTLRTTASRTECFTRFQTYTIPFLVKNHGNKNTVFYAK